MGIVPTSDQFPLLVVLNPFSGKGQSSTAWNSIIVPALNKAGKSYKVIETQAQGQAQSYFVDHIKFIIQDQVQSLGIVNESAGSVDGTGSAVSPPISRPISATLQIMVLGGDGTVHEIINGILQGVKGTPFASDEFRPKVEFSIIPTGTGNAISTSLGITSVQDAVDRFLVGKTALLRVMGVSTRASLTSHWKEQVYTVVVNSFGLHCAIVYDSEEFRDLGNERFNKAATKNIENLKQYVGQLDLFGPVQSYDRKLRTLTTPDMGTTQGDHDDITVSLTGPFTYLLITKQASLEPGFTPTPLASTSDEWMDILAVQNAGQQDLLRMFDMMKVAGQHMEQEKVEYFKAKVVELETPTPGRLCIDGEFLEIQGGPEGRMRTLVPSYEINGPFDSYGIYYDNVGGSTLEAAFEVLKHQGRVVICGMISGYNASESYHVKNLVQILLKRLTVRDSTWRSLVKRSTAWLLNNQIIYKEDIMEGLENAPETFVGIFEGKNFGKAVVKIADL
ncbi:hypothetical protein BGZ65_005256 [Modicella reniformis]|uniref:DAGKc domain-containing protein n=1 Tax=Modicella reniformis TaxID=1440133 RepID=A0A9P6SPU7_9FUNG|nr:hypothetical protein BGZ65_005256 [Modicella reniformis]